MWPCECTSGDELAAPRSVVEKQTVILSEAKDPYIHGHRVRILRLRAQNDSFHQRF